MLFRTPAGIMVEERIARPGEQLHAPHLLDLEVAQVLRRYVLAKTLSEERGRVALDLHMTMRLVRHRHDDLLPRIWQLRENLTAYDAAYIALAELLEAPLLTRDTRLAGAAGHRARIELVEAPEPD